jgi:hypothetical protein
MGEHHPEVQMDSRCAKRVAELLKRGYKPASLVFQDDDGNIAVVTSEGEVEFIPAD